MSRLSLGKTLMSTSVFVSSAPFWFLWLGAAGPPAYLHSRFLHLSDSQVVISALARGRSSSRALPSVLTRAQAYLLASSAFALCRFLTPGIPPTVIPGHIVFPCVPMFQVGAPPRLSRVARARATRRVLRSPLGSVFRRWVAPRVHIRYRSVLLRFTSWLFVACSARPRLPLRGWIPSWLLSSGSCGRRASLVATRRSRCVRSCVFLPAVRFLIFLVSFPSARRSFVFHPVVFPCAAPLWPAAALCLLPHVLLCFPLFFAG